MNTPLPSWTLAPSTSHRRIPVALRAHVASVVGLVLLGLLAPRAVADLPLACCVYYGQARDAFGTPYTHDAEVVLRLGSVEVTRSKINGALAPGVNFRLCLPLDDGQNAAYASYAARPGDPVQILLRTAGTEQVLAETVALTVGEPGQYLAVYVSAGADADHDGLPDAWEWELVQNSGGRLKHPVEVLPNDDFDGDGLSNLEEYLAGTYAFLAYDVLAVEELTWLADGQVRLRFLPSVGITYQVEASPVLGPNAQWQPVPFGFAGESGFPHEALLGDGLYLDLFVPASDSLRFFRMSAR